MKSAVRKTGFLALCVAAVIVVSLFSVIGAVGAEDAYSIDTPYEYPIKPGMDEWDEILDHAANTGTYSGRNDNESIGRNGHGLSFPY